MGVRINPTAQFQRATHVRKFKMLNALLNRCELDPCVYDVFDSETALELNPEIVILTPGTLCILVRTRPASFI
jgi:hypothetical protein